MPANDKGDLATPWVYKAGPAAVNGDVLAVSRKETDGGVIKWLTCILQNCWKWKQKKKSNLKGLQSKTANLKYMLNLLSSYVDKLNHGCSYSCDEQQASMVGHLGAD